MVASFGGEVNVMIESSFYKRNRIEYGTSETTSLIVELRKSGESAPVSRLIHVSWSTRFLTLWRTKNIDLHIQIDMSTE